MGVTGRPEQYETSIKILFPRGEYWERQFSDPQSDVSKFCRAKVFNLLRLRCKMAALRDESMPQSAEELLDCWERVLLGAVFSGIDIQQRRDALLNVGSTKITLAEMQKTADLFGFIITGARLPYRPAFFGFSRFGIDPLAGPAAWQAVYIFVNTQGGGGRRDIFEAYMRNKLLASSIPYFFYDGGTP